MNDRLVKRLGGRSRFLRLKTLESNETHRFRLVRALPIDRPKSRDRSAIDQVPSVVSRDRSHQIPRSIGCVLVFSGVSSRDQTALFSRPIGSGSALVKCVMEMSRDRSPLLVRTIGDESFFFYLKIKNKNISNHIEF